MRSPYFRPLVAVCLCLLISSCVPPADENSYAPVTGNLELPSGSTVAPSACKVLALTGESAVADDGSFPVLAPKEGKFQVCLTDAVGNLMLTGFAGPTGGKISARETAVVLAYYALGGFTLPPEYDEALFDLILASPAVDTLAAVIETKFLANPTVITDGDDDLTTAIQAARDALAPETTKLIARVQPVKALLPFASTLAAEDDTSNTLIQIDPDANTKQSGIQIFQNPSGDGIVAQNSFRRWPSMVCYQTGKEDEQGIREDFYPPKQIGDFHNIPSTDRLEFFNAIWDVISGDSPYAPILSDPVDLPLAEGSQKTFYEIVVLGPTLDFVTTPPVWSDTLFFSFTDSWNNKMDSLVFKTFWLDFAWPVIETFLFVKGANAQQAKLDSFVDEFKSLCDSRLANLGVILRSKEDTFLVFAVQIVLDTLKNDGRFRIDFRNACQKALFKSALNQANFEAMEGKLKAMSSAAAVVAAVQVAFATVDVAAVIKDLQSSRSGEVWSATVIPANVHLEPPEATVTKNQVSASFTASVGGAPNEDFVYRWSTTGTYGIISDNAGKQGKNFDSTQKTVNYMVDPGAMINGELDTVTVEVFEDDGSGTIPNGAFSIGKATSKVLGDRGDEDGPVWLDTYPHNQPEIDDYCSISAHVGDGVEGPFILKWSTSGNYGKLEGREEKEFETDDFDVGYWPNDDAKDKDTDWVKCEVYRVIGSSRTFIGEDQVTMDIWNPTTVYALCGDAAGQKHPYLGSGTAWNFNVVGHGPWMGSGFYARQGDQVRASLYCHDGACSYDLGPVYIRRGNVGDPTDLTVLIAAEGTYSCTPPEDDDSCNLTNLTVPLP